MADTKSNTRKSTPTPVTPDCRDFDEDCHDIKDKVHCYLYDPAKGMCPYLREK